MEKKIANIFADLPDADPEEVFETLLECNGLRIERITSAGQTTEPDQWYDQGWDEWVLLVSGSAALLFADEEQPRELRPGDYLFIPAGCRHRVIRTDSREKTVWLAVHLTAT